MKDEAPTGTLIIRRSIIALAFKRVKHLGFNVLMALVLTGLVTLLIQGVPDWVPLGYVLVLLIFALLATIWTLYFWALGTSSLEVNWDKGEITVRQGVIASNLFPEKQVFKLDQMTTASGDQWLFSNGLAWIRDTFRKWHLDFFGFLTPLITGNLAIKSTGTDSISFVGIEDPGRWATVIMNGDNARKAAKSKKEAQEGVEQEGRVIREILDALPGAFAKGIDLASRKTKI